MKFPSALLVATQLFQATESQTTTVAPPLPGILRGYWPAQTPWSRREFCGSHTELPFFSNQTCTITLTKGHAAWINAGGLFSTARSMVANSWEVHTYDNFSGPPNLIKIPLNIFYNLTKLNIEYLEWDANGPKYPHPWDKECFTKADQMLGEVPATIFCEEYGGEIQGIFMMSFAWDQRGNGNQMIQVKNTNGHTPGYRYTIELRNKDQKATPVGSAFAHGVNATVTYVNNTITIDIKQTYLGELLPVTFSYLHTLERFEPAQAFYSSITETKI